MGLPQLEVNIIEYITNNYSNEFNKMMERFYTDNYDVNSKMAIELFNVIKFEFFQHIIDDELTFIFMKTQFALNPVDQNDFFSQMFLFLLDDFCEMKNKNTMV